MHATISPTEPEGEHTTSDWRHRARCAGTSPEAAEGFFAFDDQAELIEAAKRVCGGCPVIDQCREWAIAHGADHGVWGGLTAEERIAMRRARARTRRTRRAA
jgi:WhiB family transcriptional regulator, redox-sensing transcriptional regulator